MNKIISWLIVGAVIILAGLCIYKFSAKPPVMEMPSIPAPETQVQTTSEPSPAPEPVLPKTYYINITSYKFVPDSIIIKAEDTIVWENSDLVTHTVSSNIGKELNSGRFSTGVKYTHKFNTTGTYNYHCNIYPTMKGTIIVE